MYKSSPTQQARQRHSRELAILNEIAHALNASLDLTTLLRRALEKVAELLALRTGWVFLLHETTGEPYLAAALNLPSGLRREPERMAGWCYCLDSFCRGDIDNPFNVGVVTCSRLQELALVKGDTAGLRYHASIPLRVYTGSDAPGAEGAPREGEFKRLGMLNVTSPGWRKLTDDELDFLRTVGDVLSVAIERARLHAQSVAAAQAAERNRLAREIHDTLAQDLAGIAFKLEAVDALLNQQAAPKEVRRNLAEALTLARKALEDARRSVLDLRAAPLEGRTLAQALADLAQQTATELGLAVTFELGAPIGALPPAVETGLYRVAQEALKNVQRHAHATQVTIRLDLDATDKQLLLAIQDNGQGFDIDRVLPRGAAGKYGLMGITERVKLLKGELAIQSSPTRGTRLLATVPLAVANG